MLNSDIGISIKMVLATFLFSLIIMPVMKRIAHHIGAIDIPRNSDTELINYELFNEKELKYIVNNNILYGAMNKLAYYNLINNVETRNSKTGIYKVLKKKKTNL